DRINRFLRFLIHDLAEGGIFAIQEGGGFVADEELRAGGIRIVAARHGQDARLMAGRVELGLDAIAGAACTGTLRTAPLNHESFNDAMKDETVVEPNLAESEEILDVSRRQLRKKLQANRAFTR